ncbi:hypothetical protein AWZ03_004669 [Drosophila navojoa]|uniref:Ras-related protein Rab n=1 Tax=Drosophila navojoa TaxID=7232 RepID=A0A484BMB5_DRONA|nr:actin cytoskeleton-regulatory complex protein pan1 isoform X1 [Drosophila navojoa]TDG48985.1 hypothetical protein AWZ03_004669 [Drosophila navojoa]
MQKADKQAKAEQAQTGKSKAKEKVKRNAAAAEGGAEAGVGGGATAEQDLELESPRAKARSRFSAAFRSLKTKKQEKEKPKPSSAEQLTAISSGEAEDLTSLGEISLDSELKSSQKKKSLTRRLLLGSLKPKTKERPHSLATSDELSLKSSGSGRERERALGTGLGSGSSSTLKITISGKKVETVEVKGRGETDYLTPIPTQTATEEATAATATVKPTATATATKETAKLIVAKVVSKEQSKQKKQSKQPKQPKQQLRAAPQIEEKIVITESRRDTPPRERAPAKPSRASSSQSANSAGEQHKSSSASRAVSLPSREKRALTQQQQLQQQQQRGHRLNKGSNTAALEKEALVTPPGSELQPAPAPASSTPELRPPSPPTSSTLVLVSLAESSDAVSLAESAQTAAAPVVRFAVGSAVRGPDAYELALAAAANQQPSSSEEPSDSSLRRLSFKQQLALSDHDSIEGRRETVRYQSVASEYGEDQDTGDEQEEDDGPQLDKDAKPMPAFGDLTMDQEMEPTIMSPSGEKREHLYKILVIGELGTGKTSFIKRYVHQFFSQNYRATIGVDFALKVLHWDANTIVRLQLWDIAGQERFGNMTRVYYKEAVGAFIVFDVTRSGTFDCVSKWKEDLDSKVQLPDGSPIPCILLANKCDQEKQGIVTQPERMDEYVRENGFAGWFETSAKENINIDEAARALVNKILINDKLITADANDAEKFNLSAADASAETKNKCSC